MIFFSRIFSYIGLCNMTIHNSADSGRSSVHINVKLIFITIPKRSGNNNHNLVALMNHKRHS